MCFSATASFSAGAVLSGFGAITLSKAGHPREYPFASIPLLFGIQQITEGFVWLSMTHPDYAPLRESSMWFFLLFAQPLWPLLIPLSVWLLEEDPKRKKQIAIFGKIGSILAAYLFYCLLTFEMTAEIMEHHIRYYLYFPKALVYLTFPAYLLTTLVPTFLSTVRKMRIYAVFNLVSFLLSIVLYLEYLVSVWCFFAAGLSISVLIVITELQRTATKRVQLQSKKII
ncbi:DUF6629 family protein [Flavilitoribacter nigricans]|uniref:Histidine kinase N-terminal 7TM region domain-containing protein n=1 Tax=Flavilitoribacter nigricans (strain ATCC 23147 / DSM 23189 / NBRC 102662 / NCIMB 1420 / SS-2) TaxID=1122177 RepID=A0A2D0NEG2_FLAN2|nr:DUF6629 family protein [Flavilitoribacter nigricans]PHN06891.1 hypothetical protein CRP01_09225 [Flavilitoribacter nigricans DSM 23189 = NBRC 102662]